MAGTVAGAADNTTEWISGGITWKIFDRFPVAISEGTPEDIFVSGTSVGTPENNSVRTPRGIFEFPLVNFLKNSLWKFRKYFYMNQEIVAGSFSY